MKEDYEKMLSEARQQRIPDGIPDPITAQEYAKILGCSDRWARHKINQLGWVCKGTKKVINLADRYSYVPTYGPE